MGFGLSVRAFAIAGGLIAASTACAGGDDVEPAEVIRGLQYYYACQNEILELPDGRRFYPLLPGEQINTDRYHTDASANPAEHLRAVVDPGPGDDTGRLIVFADGIAHWESDSGIEAWLTAEERQYNWDC